ncbi:MAG: aldo/keto reductase [Pseudomonadota bacterium]|nr:aldo/keto reductase [Pseudomonadota bacterium]
MDLALGTVQFGMLYGVAGGKCLPTDDEVRRILELAFERGITMLDTAPAYGNIEARLGSLCDNLDFKIVSKIPPLPNELDDISAGQWAVESAQSSRERLGYRLYALLFHRAEDLLDARGDAVLDALAKWATAENILIGASGYDVATVRYLFERQRISIAQLPGNALDQRIGTVLEKLQPKPELHLRSAFLQGLLLLPFDDAVRLVPAATTALQQWHHWIRFRGMTALQGALSIVKAFEDVSACVVGVDKIAQLAELLNAWRDVQPIRAADLASYDSQAIDPRLWR